MSSQIIEGAFNAILFENFIYQTLRHIRTDKEQSQRKVVLLMDNAIIHRFSEVLETAKRFKVVILFNAEYSPWLNPIEQLFAYVKQQLRSRNFSRK